ncbi:LssY C-terminal domain-containing protein [Undibacterium sp. SXout11W]|uniref:LssY C-terminal domain-containing protein n=1 Tax=Undibacterium sp. SXout11W TaxID=3413050 RepID=UPI003BF308D7
MAGRRASSPALADIGTRAFTSAGIPGDPLNIAFIGSEQALQDKMLKAGWFPADPIILRSSLRIAKDSIKHKLYPDAPVIDLFVNGCKQDLAFEQAAGGDPSKRHHVRFWQGNTQDDSGRPSWIGAATYDAVVGLSYTTGPITHHIAAEVDKERDKLIADLQQTGSLVVQWIDLFQPTHEGPNGGGDRFVTDGKLGVMKVDK